MKNQTIIDEYIGEGFSVEENGDLLTYKIEAEDVVKICGGLYLEHKLPLKIITAFDEREENGFFKVMYVFGVPKTGVFIAPYILVKESFPSLTSTFHEASIYERKIMSFFGLKARGHPFPRQVVLHENWPSDMYPLRKDFDWNTRPAIANNTFEFKKVEGEGVYEIPVGPVHAGIIEPGHFRFSVVGEEIQLLESRLGYSHKGTEKLFETLKMSDKIKLSERISGDSSFSYSMLFCQTIEKLAGFRVSDRAEYIRVVLAELERLANHFGDIGLIMADTGYNLGGAEGARLRELTLQLHERLTGSRFMRGMNTIGGVVKDLTDADIADIKETIATAEKGFEEIMAIADNSATLLNRLKDTGTLDVDIAKDHGATGVAGRAVGFNMDARVDFPYAKYKEFDIEPAVFSTGDVYARYMVRVTEVRGAFGIIRQALEKMPKGEVRNTSTLNLPKNGYAVGVVEGWRGDIVCVISTDKNGEISRVAMRDPSFLNWTALGYSGRGNMVPDFPLINKSFNLSYSGNDL